MQAAPPGRAPAPVAVARSAQRPDDIAGRSPFAMAEAERRHVAREIHDTVGQALTVVRLSLVAARAVPDTHLDAHLDECLASVDMALEVVRGIARNLRPAVLDDLGLVPALRGYLRQQAALGGFAAELRADPQPGRLGPDLEITCFRIVQEAVTNVQRHAVARHVSVELTEDASALVLRIVDDGRGFDVAGALRHATARGTFGLVGMRERAHLAGGELEIHSQPGHGTAVRAHLPLGRRAAVAGPG